VSNGYDHKRLFRQGFLTGELYDLLERDYLSEEWVEIWRDMKCPWKGELNQVRL